MTSQFDYAARGYERLLANAPTLLLAFLTLLIGSWLINKLVHITEEAMRKRNVDPTIRPFFGSLINFGLKAMLFISVAGMFGIQTTSFVAMLGAATFAVGLALQGSLGHFASGVLLLLFKPYKVGDLVTVNGQTGTVESIQIFNTVLGTLDNKRIIVPNGLVTSNVITNISGQGVIRVDMNYGIDGAEDIDRARAIILSVAAECTSVIQSKPVDVVVNELKPGVTQLAVCPWANSVDYWTVYFYMHEHIQKAFVAAGIKTPRPMGEIQIVSGTATAH